MKRGQLRRGQQRRHGQPRTKGPAGFRQEIKDMTLLATQGNNYRQEAFNKTATCLTLGSKATFTPEDAATQGLFSGIVGRRNAFMVNKAPQRRFMLEQVMTGGLGLPVRHQEDSQLQQSCMAIWQAERVRVPSRTRCQSVNICLVWSSNRRPITADSPPRSTKAWKSRCK